MANTEIIRIPAPMSTKKRRVGAETPPFVWVGASCALLFLLLPLVGLLKRVAWSGIFQVLGGEAEIFRNPIEPDHVARLSSRRLPANDDGHQLGRRVGRAIAAGFRCYREVFP